MKKLHGKEGGFTLVEILIVLALLGILLAVVIPNLTGFLGRGKDESYRTDSRTLQAAVDAYYTDTAKRPGVRYWPTLNGTSVDLCTGNCGTTLPSSANSYVLVDDLKSEGYLRDIPQSGRTENLRSGTGPGSYIWFIHTSGVVSSWHPTTLARGYVSGVYP